MSTTAVLGLGAGVAFLWAVAGFTLGFRLGQRRAHTTVIMKQPAAHLGNTVARIPQQEPRSWQQPDWATSSQLSGPAGGLEADTDAAHGG